MLCSLVSSCSITDDKESIPVSCKLQLNDQNRVLADNVDTPRPVLRVSQIAKAFGSHKYCLDESDVITISYLGKIVKLYRIVAVRDIAIKLPGRKVVKIADYGEKGGYVERWENLSQEGVAWVGDSAQVYGNARVHENAQVYGSARVYGDARIYGNALVFENARVLDRAKVYDEAEVYGNAMVFDLAESVFTSRDLTLTFYNNSFLDDNVLMYPFSEDNTQWRSSPYQTDTRILISSDSPTIEDIADSHVPTEIFGSSRVFDDAKVWGGSHIYGDHTGISIIKDASRVSGGSHIISGTICGRVWLNSTAVSIVLRCDSYYL